VISPADGGEIVKAVQALVRHKGPVFLRLTGAMNNPIVYREDYAFTIGKAVPLLEGADVAILACGTMVYEALEAAKRLAASGISASVTNVHTVKPLDTDAVDRACARVGLVVTVEEHSTVGGLGGAVAEHNALRSGSPPQLFLGLPDRFGKNGDYKYLLKKYRLVGESVAEDIQACLRSTETMRGQATRLSGT
jgi:transketolase